MKCLYEALGVMFELASPDYMNCPSLFLQP